MRENCLGLFRLGALWRLMRCVSTPSNPPIDAKLTTADCIPVLTPRSPRASRSSSLQVRSRNYTHSSFSSHAISYSAPSLWRTRLCAASTSQDVAPGNCEVRPPHVRRALQTCSACMGKHAHFDALLARFNESEEEVPLALLIQRRSDDEEEVEEEDRDWTDDKEEANVEKHVRLHS